MNTFFRKGYLLAGVMMAANMFVVNEVRATEEDNNIRQNDFNERIGEKEKNTFPKVLDMASEFVLSRENTINLIGGTVSSVANNYLKLWDYNAGRYLNLRIGCLGWRSKKLFDIVQVGINLNLGRGILWLIPGTYNFIKACKTDKQEVYTKPLHFSFLVADRVEDLFTIVFIGVFLIQGFVSVPLAIHISNFSISISLDSMLWAGIGFFLDKTEEKKEGTEELNLENIKPNA